MGLLGVVGGHSILDMIGDDGTAFGRHVARRTAQGVTGPVAVLDADGHVLLQRHGLDGYVPAHRVDHARNMSALAAVGCDRVLAISSVGALRTELRVGTHVAPDDFIALDQPPSGVHGDERSHVVPGFTPAWRAQVIDAWREAGATDVVDGGVYWQANGPRFETPAEIRLIAGFADVVGMTVGAECVAANELGLAYAAVCVIDNLANGLDAEQLTPEQFAAGKQANQARVLQVLTAVLAILGT
jgi:5'-methylthioadenosine phosphorylase